MTKSSFLEEMLHTKFSQILSTVHSQDVDAYHGDSPWQKIVKGRTLPSKRPKKSFTIWDV